MAMDVAATPSAIAKRSEPLRPWRTWARRLTLAVAGLVILACAVLVLGAHFPFIDYVGVFGSVALSLWSALFIVVPLAAGALAWKISGGNIRRALVLLALFTALGAGVVTFRLVTVARTHGVTIGSGDPFGFSNGLVSVAADDVLVYTHDLGDELRVRLYRPKGNPPVGGWPVLMYVHGGGWVAGSSEARSADMRWFADHGWISLSIDYSLSNEQRHLWDRVIQQVGCALAWTGANIASRGGDASRLALIGESAGGNLVLNAAYLANAGKLQSTCGGAVPRVQAVSAVYPGVDLVAIYENSYALTGPDVRGMVTKYVGGSPRQFPDRYSAVASATHLTAAAPPTLLFVSENDHLVPLESMQAFDAKARRAGIPIRTVSVPYAEHGFDLVGIGNAIVRQVTLQFIRQHGRVDRADVRSEVGE